MAKPTEQRILEWLNQFDDSLQNAWDIPRENSLPGIADAIGVVRSALHNPIKSLQNKSLIKLKQAHVINGGSRKRTVHFITKKGREYCKNIDKKIKTAEIVGNAPNLIKLVGREKELMQIKNKLTLNNMIIIYGIAGIGKTAIVRTLVEEESKEGIEIKWYSANSLSSPKSMVETWLGVKKLSANLENLFSIIKSEIDNQILVIDNFDCIKSRFKDEILELLNKLTSLNIKIIITSRPPIPITFENNFEIEGLDKKSSQELLKGFNKDEIQKIIEYFDGHPLGLAMVKRDISFEKIKKDIESFFEKEILQTLNEDIICAIHELAIQPEPIEIDFLSYKEQIADLDELSLVTFQKNKIQLHNLVKNILISKLNEEEKQKLHNSFTIHLSNFSSENSRFLRLYHEIKSGIKGNKNWIKDNVKEICIEFPSKSSSFFHERINTNNSNGDDYWYAAISECELGNGGIAKNLFENAKNLTITNENLVELSKLNCRILRLNGEIEKSEEILKKIPFKNELDKIKFLIGEISRKIDDRIPNQKPNLNSIKILDMINLNSLTIEDRRSCLIAIAIIKHTFSLYNNDLEQALEIRKEIIMLSSKNSEIVKDMELKNAIISGENINLNNENSLRNVGLICWMLEFGKNNKSELLLRFKTIIENNPELNERQAGRRGIALFWTWVGILDDSRRALAWSQAISRWSSSECYEAAKSLQKKLQNWLKETGRA